MRRFAVPGIITAVVVALLAVLAFGIANQGSNSSIDSRVASGRYPLAPSASMSLPLLSPTHPDRSTESLSKLRGKVVLINVFASWCPPWKAEAPVLHRAQQLLAAHDGTVIGVAYQDNSGNDLRFMRRYH